MLQHIAALLPVSLSTSAVADKLYDVACTVRSFPHGVLVVLAWPRNLLLAQVPVTGCLGFLPPQHTPYSCGVYLSPE